MRPSRDLLLIVATILVIPQFAFSQFWEDDFNTDTSQVYDVLIFTEGRDRVEFAYDYSQVGIPEAPNSTNGGTTGVRFSVNDDFPDTVPQTTGVQIVPTGLEEILEDNDFEFTITYDLWMNVNGPLPAGGTGSTEAMMVGVGFSGLDPIEAGNTDGTYFTLTGEGGAATDVRSFSTNVGYNGSNPDGTPINVSDSLEDPYFAEIFPGGIDVSTLPVQGGVDNQTGITDAGQMAFEWHQVRVDVRDNVVSFYVDDLLIAREVEAWVEGNIFVGYADYFSSVSDFPEWHFSIVDNLKVFPPLIGDFNRNGVLDAPDIDLLSAEVREPTGNLEYDLNGDEDVTNEDRIIWVTDPNLANTYFGDANLDGQFNTGDFVLVLSAGEYEDGIPENSTWATGDWNGDADFDTGDLVLALSDGGYELGPRAGVLAVPEPSSILLALIGLGLLAVNRRRS